MEKSANYFTVGLFVSVTLLALVGFIIWLAGAHHFGRYDRYTIYFTDPISGLTEDATVRYKGLPVGRILDTRLASDRSDLLKVDIEVKEGTPVTAETVAQLETQGLTGQGHLELSTAKLGGSPPPTPEGERYPVLKGQGSKLAKFLDDLPNISKQLEATLGSITTFTKGGTKTVESIKSLSDSLKENPSQILTGPQTGKGVEIPK
jgi:phospholipid/cholesterol/gamma-HCH transport system substrate-binding protein